MKILMIITICALTFVTCGSKNSSKEGAEANADGSRDLVISGKVTNPPAKPKIYITELRNDRQGWRDSIELKADNTFSKKVHIPEAGYYALNFFDRQMFNIILYKNDVKINVDGNAVDGKPEIIGSPEQDIVNTVQTMMEAAQNTPQMLKLKEEFNTAAQANNGARVSELQLQYMQLLKADNDKVAEYLLKQPASLATVEILAQGNIINKDDYPQVYADAAAKLKKEMPNSIFVKPFLDEMENSKATAIGSVAPEINMPDPSGRIIKLSSLRGKYVLIDFWAKWCGPCRRENPNVVKAYHRFKDKGFEVFGVSLDRDKADWIEAIQQDGLVWTQVSDLRYFESKAAKDYNINAIPFSVLLDPKGIIVAKNLRGPALESKLAELLDK